MTREEIEKASDFYSKISVPQFENAESIILTKAYKIGFIAGAEYRQEEIDELVDILKRLLSHNYDYEAINIGNELLKKYKK